MSWNTPDDLKYTETDEWVRMEDGTATVGISDYAQDQLSDVVFVELPTVGDALARGDTFGAVESVKAAAEINMPLSGTITNVNSVLDDQPEMVNRDPFGEAWIIRVKVAKLSELEHLMDKDAYEQHCERRAH